MGPIAFFCDWTDANRHPATKHLDLPLHLHLPLFQGEADLQSRVLPRSEVATALPKSGLTDVRLLLVGFNTGAKGEAIDLSLLPLHFFSMFSAQKWHVKPQNHLTYSNKRKSSWHVSYPQPAIIK